jgi:hypothetical protein
MRTRTRRSQKEKRTATDTRRHKDQEKSAGEAKAYGHRRRRPKDQEKLAGEGEMNSQHVVYREMAGIKSIAEILEPSAACCRAWETAYSFPF